MLRMRQVTVVRGPSQPAGPQQVVEPVPPALRAIARWRFARASRLPRPQGAHFFQVRDLRPEVGDLLGELLLARRLGLRTGSRAPRPALGLRAQGPGPPVRYSRHQRSRGATLAIAYLAMTSVLVMSLSTWSRAAATFVPPPVVAAFALRAHDRVLSVGPVFHDPFFRGLHGHRKPAGKEMLAHAGLDEPRRLVPEPVVVTFPPILPHTKNRTSNHRI